MPDTLTEPDPAATEPDTLNEPVAPEHWSLGEDYQGEEFQSDEVRNVLRKYESPQALAKALVDAQPQIGKPFKLPKSIEKLSEEQREQFRAALNTLRGVPEKAEDYEFTVPEGVEVNDDAMASWREHCKKTGKSNADAQADLDFYYGLIAQAREAQEKAENEKVEANHKANAECNKALRAKFGRGFDAQMELNKRAIMRTLGVDNDQDPKFIEFDNRMRESGLGNEIVLNLLLSEAANVLEREGSIEAVIRAGGKAENKDRAELAQIKQDYPETWKDMLPESLRYLITD